MRKEYNNVLSTLIEANNIGRFGHWFRLGSPHIFFFDEYICCTTVTGLNIAPGPSQRECQNMNVIS